MGLERGALDDALAHDLAVGERDREHVRGRVPRRGRPGEAAQRRAVERAVVLVDDDEAPVLDDAGAVELQRVDGVLEEALDGREAECGDGGGHAGRDGTTPARPAAFSHAVGMERGAREEVPRHVVVLGLMASGKTTVARGLAALLARPLSDSDAVLEAATGRTVRALRDERGVAALHALEAGHLLDALASPAPLVIAAAASAIDDDRCVAALRRADAILLRASPAVLAARFAREAHRPAYGDDPATFLAAQAARRLPRYALVDPLVVDVDALDAAGAIDAAATALAAAGRRRAAGRLPSAPVATDPLPGLSSEEAARRLAAAGPRERDTGTDTAGRIVRRNVLTLINAITLVFLALILAAGAWNDAVFAAVIAVNTLIGIAQELRAKRQLDRLSLLVAPRARVRRDGRPVELLAEEVVVGDVIELAAGDQLVADGVVRHARGLALDESVLTGEANQVPRGEGERVLSGAYCAAGSGLYEVDAIGDDSFAARLTAEARTIARGKTTLQLEIDRLLRILILLMIPLAALLALAFWFHEVDVRTAVETATAGLISVVPEGLILLASVTLAVAAVRLSRAGALVQRLNAVESLASVDLVCLDKTGTLTEGRLELVEVLPASGYGEEAPRDALRIVAGAAEGRSATSDAIRDALGPSPLPARRELPFSSRWKWSAVELADGRVLVLGAPEVLGVGNLVEAARERQAQRARVLVVGTASTLPELPEDGSLPHLPDGFAPLGLAVMREAMREDALRVVGWLRREGVALKVLSGDAPATVEAIARAAGFPETTAISGADLPAEPAALAAAARTTSVFGRVTPEQKQRIVESLVGDGRYVAMVGDGVNDVPAMKAARVAIALGNGAQIAKGVADIVLVREDFGALPRGIEEGRRILANLRRVAKLFVVKSAFAATLILTVGVAGSAYPLLPRHLTLAGALTVGIPAFALALAPSRGRAPRLSFMRDLLRFAVPGGVVSALAVLAAYGVTKALPDRGLADARTVAVLVLVAVGLYLVLLLEDEAMEESRVRAWGVGALFAALVALLVAAFALAPVRRFFALEVPDVLELLVVVAASLFAIGVLGVLGFRWPLVARRLFGAERPAGRVDLGA